MIETVLGPPGCGKTTELLNILEAELALGTAASSIAFVSFTKRAVLEAQERIQARFGIGAELAPWIRTLHSTAFRLMGLRRDEVMGESHWKEFGDLAGYAFSRPSAEEWAPKTEGDALLGLYQYAQASGQPLEDVLHRFGPVGLEPWHAHRFLAEVRHYKTERGLVEFSDMLACRSTVDAEVVIVDEAQDLSAEQWRFADHVLLQGAQRVYLAGDDDQAIYAWSGANPAELQRRAAAPKVLAQSWRVPARIHRFAGRVVSRIRQRLPKVWHPREEMGGVYRVGHLDSLPIQDREGSWLLLARNQYLLDQYKHHCRREGILYAGAVRKAHATAIHEWEQLRRGRDADAALALEWSKTLTTLPDNLPPWFDALDRISLAEREYYRAAMRRGQKLLAPPRVRISTIHGAKGAEADHVALLSDMAFRSYEGQDCDDEHRVWYVGVTRARKTLHLVDATTPWAYKWPL